MSEPLKGGFAAFAGTSPFKTLGSTGSNPSPFGSAASANNGAAPTPTGTSAFGGGGNLFGAKPAGNTLFGGGSTTGTPGNNPSSVPAFGGTGNLFGANNAANNQAPVTNPPPAFGGTGLFGSKPSETATPTSGAGVGSTPAFGGSGLFGAKPATPNPTTAPGPSGNLFGDKPAPAANTPAFGNAFGAKPADAANSAAPKPNLFGNAGAATNASQPTTNQPSTNTTTATPSLFSKPPESSATATATASSGAPAFGLFGKKPETPNQNSGTPATTSTTPAIPSLFGGAKKDDTADKNTIATTTTPGVGLFGAKPVENKEGEKKDNAAPTTSLFGTTSTTNTTNTTTIVPSNLSVPPPSMLRGKTIEEIVNKWSTDLESHVKEFSRLAGEITVWDRTLIDNGNTIAALLQHVLLAEREQADIEQSLKHVEDQQKELASTLEVYEKAAGEIFDGQGSGLRALDVGPADAERDKHYTLAADLNANLDDLTRTLMQMIDSVNELSESPEDASGVEGAQSKNENPLEQIAQILSSHLESLQWIDGAVREVDSKVTEVERLVREASSGSRVGGNASTTSNPVGLNGSTRSRGFGFR